MLRTDSLTERFCLESAKIFPKLTYAIRAVEARISENVDLNIIFSSFIVAEF